MFDLTLFGNAHALFPYILLAVREAEETHGISRRLDAGGERGRYRQRGVTDRDPHSALAETLFRAPDKLVTQSSMVVTSESITRRVRVDRGR